MIDMPAAPSPLLAPHSSSSSSAGPNRKTRRAQAGAGATFDCLGLSPPLLRAVRHKGYRLATPIQRKCIPLLLDGSRDVVAMARTGSGKTAAFLLPLIDRLKSHSPTVGVRALILSPTRELALQTMLFAKDFAKHTDLRVTAFVGGDNMDNQFSAILGNPDIIVATPGRLLHLVVESNLPLSRVEFLVFDEADRLFELGFETQLIELMHRMPSSPSSSSSLSSSSAIRSCSGRGASTANYSCEARVTALFSATLPRSLVDFARAGLRPDPALVRLDTESKLPADLALQFFSIKACDKDAALLFLLRELIGAPSGSNDSAFLARPPTIVFAATRHGVEYLTLLLIQAGHEVAHVYGALDMSLRKENLARFAAGRADILVVTDVAARGIDLPAVAHVINYDFPTCPKIFVHRVGRAGRAGRTGTAWSLVTSDDLAYLVDVELFVNKPITTTTTTTKSKINETTQTSSSSLIGHLPSSMLQPQAEQVFSMVRSDPVLAAQQATALRAWEQFSRTRASASGASHKRAKELLRNVAGGFSSLFRVHETLGSRLSSAEIERQSLVSELSAFRPSESVFEVGARGAANETAALMRKRRAMVASIKRPAQDPCGSQRPAKREQIDQNTSSTPAASEFRDEKNYIDYVPGDYESERGYAVRGAESLARGASSAIVNVVGDDSQTTHGRPAQTRVGSMVWDNKKKKFKRAALGEDNKALIKGESGVRLPATMKSDRFARWKRENRVVVPHAGQAESAKAKEFAAAAVEARRYRHNSKGAQVASQPAARGAGEGARITRNAQQITRQRLEKERKRAKNGRKASRKTPRKGRGHGQ